MRDDESVGLEFTEEEEFGADPQLVRRERPDLGPEWERDTSLDITEVRLEDPELGREAGEPEWVIRANFVDEHLGVIKSGKEADVTLVRRTSGDRSILLARKTFRPRSQRAFRREEDYRDGQSFGDGRVDRAVRDRSRYGRAVLEYAWAYREFPLMRAAWHAGALVPYPVDAVGEAFFMQYLGDEDGPAPRMAEVRLDPATMRRAFDHLVESMRRMLDVYLVHADLSAFNVLWWDERPWIIDFPQAVDVARSSRGLEFLQRDCENVCRWFARRGVDCDGYDVYQDLIASAPFHAVAVRDARADLDLAVGAARAKRREVPVRGAKRRR